MGNTLILSPEGRIDSSNADEFRDDVSRFITGDNDSIVLDFLKIDYISSACLRSLLSLSKQMKAANKKIALCNLKDNVSKIIKVSGFDSILYIYDDRESALNDI